MVGQDVFETLNLKNNGNLLEYLNEHIHVDFSNLLRRDLFPFSISVITNMWIKTQRGRGRMNLDKNTHNDDY